MTNEQRLRSALALAVKIAEVTGYESEVGRDAATIGVSRDPVGLGDEQVDWEEALALVQGVLAQ